MNAPKDQCLFLTVFVAVSLSVILLTWVLMPVYHHGEYYEGEETEHQSGGNFNLVLSPEKLLRKVNAAIQQGEGALVELEAKEGGKEAEASGENKAKEK